MSKPPTKPPELGSNSWMTDDRAGEIVTNVIALRARSYEALPDFLACSLDNPGGDLDEIEGVLLVRHALKMLTASKPAIERALSGHPLSEEDAKALTWLSSATECIGSSLSHLAERDYLWAPPEVERALVPFDGEIPF